MCFIETYQHCNAYLLFCYANGNIYSPILQGTFDKPANKRKIYIKYIAHNGITSERVLPTWKMKLSHTNCLQWKQSPKAINYLSFTERQLFSRRLASDTYRSYSILSFSAQLCRVFADAIFPSPIPVSVFFYERKSTNGVIWCSIQ